MPSLEAIRYRFASAIQAPDSTIDLATTALLIVQEEEPALELESCLKRLDSLGCQARALVARAETPRARLERLNTFLFQLEGFRGNETDYYDPRNSFLNHVLERRTGIPITLSLLYIEVAERAGLQGLAGVGLPGHFMVRYDGMGCPLFIDPFNQGTIRTAAECRSYIASHFGAMLAFEDDLFLPVSRRQLLARLLRNLKHIYIQRADLRRALAAIDRILLLEPDAAQEVRDRGLLQLRRGDLTSGLNDLERYGSLAPQAGDLDDIRRQAQDVASFLAPRN